MKRIIIFCLVIFLTAPLFSEDYSAVQYYNMGKTAESSGDFFKAVEMYKSALILNENFFDAVAGLAHAYYNLDEFDEALKYVLKAELLDSANTDLINLKGRINLNIGEFEQAKQNFQDVLKIEENNIDAEFGLAELDVASGQMTNAENRYENVLLVSPESRKALLALVMINDNNGDSTAAEFYIKQALKYYSDNSYVRYTAARHYYEAGNTDEALYHVKTALFLQPDFLDATLLLCTIYMKNGEYENITAEIEAALKNHRDNNYLWYVLGRAYENMGKSEEAIMSYARTLNIRPDDDLARIALENEIIANTGLDSKYRENYSSYHVDLGLKYESRNMLDKALTEYRRALVIYPYSVDARLLYADLFKRKGFIERYIMILNALVDEGFGNTDILDEIEIRKSMQTQTISEKWGIDQFSVDKEENKLSIFFNDSGMSHIEGEKILSEYIEFLMLGYDNIIIDSNNISGNFADCYRISRNNNSDYFIIFNCAENDRAVSVSADIFLSSTGSKLTTVGIVRTGNQMIPEAGKGTVSEIHNLLPVEGRIIDRKFDEIVVNLGANEGLNPGDQLPIIKKGELQKSKDGFELQYEQNAVIGTFNVSEVNELVSDGSITINNFFDMINPGDSLFIQKNEAIAEDDAAGDEQMFYTGDLFNSISNIP